MFRLGFCFVLWGFFGWWLVGCFVGLVFCLVGFLISGFFDVLGYLCLFHCLFVHWFLVWVYFSLEHSSIRSHPQFEEYYSWYSKTKTRLRLD